MCEEFSHVGIEALVRGCTLLRKLHLSLCPTINDECLSVIGNYCCHLNTLSISVNRSITDHVIGVLVTSAAGQCLEVINLDYTVVSDKAVLYLITHCPLLKRVELKGRWGVSKALQKLADDVL